MRDTIEYDVSDMDANDKGVYAKFYMFPMEDAKASAEAGRPVFADKEFVEILAAGNQNNIVRRPAGEMDKARFRKQYELFKQGDTEQMVGTPLSEVPWVTRSQVEEFAYRKVRTLEDLANISDAQCTLPGMYDLRTKAQHWMKKASDAAPFNAMMEEIEALKLELAAMKAPKTKAG